MVCRNSLKKIICLLLERGIPHFEIIFFWSVLFDGSEFERISQVFPKNRQLRQWNRVFLHSLVTPLKMLKNRIQTMLLIILKLIRYNPSKYRFYSRIILDVELPNIIKTPNMVPFITVDNKLTFVQFRPSNPPITANMIRVIISQIVNITYLYVQTPCVIPFRLTLCIMYTINSAANNFHMA